MSGDDDWVVQVTCIIMAYVVGTGAEPVSSTLVLQEVTCLEEEWRVVRYTLGVRWDCTVYALAGNWFGLFCGNYGGLRYSFCAWNVYFAVHIPLRGYYALLVRFLLAKETPGYSSGATSC